MWEVISNFKSVQMLQNCHKEMWATAYVHRPYSHPFFSQTINGIICNSNGCLDLHYLDV